MLEESIDAVLPSWLVRLDTSPTSRDPLGLAAQAGRHAEAILPGLTVFTSRARYLSFLCWAIEVSKNGAERARLDRVHRLERLLVLSEALLHEDDPSACTYIGRLRGARFVREHQSERLWELPTRVLKNQVTNGAFALYRTALGSFGLVDELDGDDFGFELTERGAKLAKRYDMGLDANIVNWALAEPDQRKQRHRLLENARKMCLSGGIDAFERRHILEGLVGTEGESIIRRQTVRVLFHHGLLKSKPRMVDIAADDADAIVEDNGRPAEEAAEAETHGNWGLLKQVLALGPRAELRDIFQASAFEMVALGLNRLFASCVESVLGPGRLALGAWAERIAERVGGEYGTRSAVEWCGEATIAQIADELLQRGLAWEVMAAQSMKLLIVTMRDAAIREALVDARVALVGQVFELAGDTTSSSAAALARQIAVLSIEHHRCVSAAKGKGEWLRLDHDDMVRGDPRPLMPILHALRFAQLEQLARDVSLSPEDVIDEA